LVIEATSGNTGIALAGIGASLNLRIVIVMPESMSIERRKIMTFFGARLVLTPAKDGMNGAIQKAEQIAKENLNSFLTSQFQNADNPNAHFQTTAKEILDDTDGKVDIFVVGVGTGGTLSGVGKSLKKANPHIKIIAVEPETSAVISGENPSPHQIQGIGAGFIPTNLDLEIIDEVIKVSAENSIQTSRSLAKTDGLLVGISSGANIYASQVIANRAENKDKIIVTTLNDTGERYISTNLFETD
jgi:cysteine synthase A